MSLPEQSVEVPDHKEDSFFGVGDAGPDVDGSAATSVLDDDIHGATSTG